VTNEDFEILDRLTKAGGIVGPSNREWWIDLEVKHGEGLLLDIITKQRASTRQPVSVAVVAKLADEAAQRLQDEADDAAEDAAAASGIAPSPKVGQIAKGTAAAVKESTGSAAAEADPQPISSTHAAPAADESVSDAATECQDGVVSTPAAGDDAKRRAAAKPWGLTKPSTKENDMATVKQTLKRIEDEVARRGLKTKDAMDEMGVQKLAIYTWRKGTINDDHLDKISAWLHESGKKPAASDDSAESAAVERKPRKKRKTPPASVTLFDSFEKQEQAGDLIERGEDLAERLKAFGCEGYAKTVTELVEKQRAVRTALSALSA
jgi:hypothetical protein